MDYLLNEFVFQAAAAAGLAGDGGDSPLYLPPTPGSLEGGDAGGYRSGHGSF